MSTRSSALLFLALAGLVAGGCGGAKLAVDGSTTITPGEPATTAPETTTDVTDGVSVLQGLTMRVYLVRGEHVAVVDRKVPETRAVARTALQALLDGPTARERTLGFTSAVPAATTLNDIALADGVATVDLSRSFESGGGSLSEMLRLAQVVYTLTQFSTVHSVRFRLDGQPVTTFSGEGIDVAAPQTRGDYESVTPRILVESPAPDTAVSCPLHITGTSNNFEATFIAELWVDGQKNGGWPVTATSGTGTRGTFDATLPCHAALSGASAPKLVVYEPSAENGEPLGQVEIPLTSR